MGSAAIEAIAEYQNDVDRSLRLYFSEASPSFSTRFFGLRPEEIQAELTARLEETNQRSAFFILTSLEAAFRVDFECRCRKGMEDDLSKAFLTLSNYQKTRARLNKDIFEAWREHWPSLRQLVGELRAAFKFRNWFAHGRYTEPRPGRNDFNSVYDLAFRVLNAFPLEESD